MANEIEFSFLEPSDLMTKPTYDTNNDDVVDVAKDIEGADTALDDTFYGKVSGVTGFHSVPAGSQTLLGLTDVNATGISNGQVLQYDGNNFVAATVTSGGSGATMLNELGDVTVGTPSNNDVLLYSGGGWSNTALATVATSGSYTDLTNQPTIFSGAYGDLTGSPTLAGVATSGSYNDLTEQPTIPDAITSIDQLDEVDITTNAPVDGQALVFDGANFVPQEVTGGSGVSSITELTDVSIGGISTGQIMEWDGSKFIPIDTPTGGGTAPTQLGALTNVDTSGQATNDVLKYDGTNWIPATIDYSEVVGTPTVFSGSYNDLTDQPDIPSAITSIDQLGEVDITTTTPNNGDSLVFDGTNFVPQEVTSGVGSLDELSDVDTTGVTENNVLKYNGTSWEDGSVAYSEVSGTPSLKTVATTGSYDDLTEKPDIKNKLIDLTDVDASGASDGQALTYDSGTSTFKPTTISGGSGGASKLDDLSDVDTTSTTPSEGDTLVYSGGEWVPQAPTASGSGDGVATIERFRINFDTDNTVLGTVGTSDAYPEYTSGITPVLTEAGTSNNVKTTVTFNGYNYPPANITFYGYSVAEDKFIMTVLNASIYTEIPNNSGDISNPDVFGGFQSITFDTTATGMGVTHKTGFGSTAGWGYVVFVMQG